MENDPGERSGKVIDTTAGLRFHPDESERQLRLTTLTREQAERLRPDLHEIDLALLYEIGTPIRVAGDFSDTDWVYDAELKGVAKEG